VAGASKGLKLDPAVLAQALKVVEDGQRQMQEKAALIRGQSDASTAAMRAQAGTITAGGYQELHGSGQILHEALEKLHGDLTAMGGHGEEGNQQATTLANNGGSTGLSGSVTSQMA
jgi:hypothetical protein